MKYCWQTPHHISSVSTKLTAVTTCDTAVTGQPTGRGSLWLSGLRHQWVCWTKLAKTLLMWAKVLHVVMETPRRLADSHQLTAGLLVGDLCVQLHPSPAHCQTGRMLKSLIHWGHSVSTYLCSPGSAVPLSSGVFKRWWNHYIQSHKGGAAATQHKP